MYEMKEPVKPSKRIIAYDIGTIGSFIAGSALMPLFPIGGLLLWSCSLVSASKSTDTENKYRDSLREYKEKLKPL